ncbi:MAG: PQQ-binding-like beta-propeller repeat protein [Acidobacteria bacterium]|nr:PQQ-binding-like beta-propeller repeat protein [Acidobacteriota bacterium]
MKEKLLLGVALVLVCLVSHGDGLAQTTNWPQFRGPNGSGISGEKNLPDEWSPDKNILWKTPIGGRGHSSPIVWGDRIFLTTDIEGDVVPGAKAVEHVRSGKVWVHPDATSGNRKHTLKVLCLDRNSGKLLWEKIAYEGTVYDDRHRKNTYASGTPVTDGKYVFAFFEAEGLYCYDFNGKLIWKTNVGKISKVGMGPGTSPVLYKDLIILQCDLEDGGKDLSFISAINKRTGKEIWRVKRDHRKTHATPLIVRSGNRDELITNGWETVVAYDPATGKELWSCEGVKGWGIPSPVANNEMVFMAAGYPNKRALGIKYGGAGNITGTQNLVWSYDKGTAYVASPILYGEYLYLISDKGILTCIEAKTGKITYEGGRVPIPASFSASPVAFDGKLFLTSEDGDTFVIKAGPVHEVLRTNSVGEPVLASPAISQGRLFIRGGQHLYCIGKS